MTEVIRIDNELKPTTNFKDGFYIPDRHILFPIVYPDLWEYIKNAKSSRWEADEIHLEKDIEDWINASEPVINIITHIMPFFATADNDITENCHMNFLEDCAGIPEIAYWYGEQAHQEIIHAETYALIIQQYLGSDVHKILSKQLNGDVIINKRKWLRNWMNKNEHPFAVRLAAFIFIEGVAFQTPFKLIYIICENGKFPGLLQSNDLISKDESKHMEFAVDLANKYLKTNKNGKFLDRDVIVKQWKEGIAIEEDFIRAAVPKPFGQISAKKMIQYLHFYADVVLGLMDYDPIYGEENPFKDMVLLGMNLDENQFTGRTTMYTTDSSNLISKKEDYNELLDEF